MELTALVLEKVSLGFGGLTVLNEVSFSVRNGDLFALIGPNGAGKTSVLNCISGIYRPSGTITFHDTSLVGLTPHDIAARGVRRTFQHGEMFAQMTIADSLLTARHSLMDTGIWSEMLRTRKMRREEERHRQAVDEMIGFFELEKFRDRKVGTLPFGLQKIVGFARALCAEPSILLLDEPSAGLTQPEREDLAFFMLKIKAERNLPMLWIEHDMQMVSDLADRVHVLDYGRSLAEGDPATVMADHNVISAYLGREAHG
ncbi:ABC transporter ATP-binding protein [Rhodoligotrophos defluvii]|uniref:ABC transporter ATP-binding protein n=1 Tax=Rhodoligotrophos defluvii TaxID=2561934 RepID=UPI00148543D9|nr:ABC transporter ATP-binding protein [Rhodoligotrophos defluvii]